MDQLFQLVATTLPHISDGQFVTHVDRWVELYNTGMATGRLPKAGSYLEIMIQQENDKFRAEWVKGFKVRPTDKESNGIILSPKKCSRSRSEHSMNFAAEGRN